MEEKQIQAEINRCVDILKNGGSILYPTDTIWGIGCDATNDRATSNIFKIKERIEEKNFIVLVDDIPMLEQYVEDIPDVAYDLIAAIDKPITIIYPKGKNLAGNVIASDGSIAIRIVKNDFCKRIITTFGKPIVSTSANLSGEPSPVNFKTISERIKNRVDFIVNPELDTLTEIKPSRIIKLETTGMFTIIRD